MFRWSIGERWMIYLVTKTRLLPSLVTKFLSSLLAKVDLSRPARWRQVLDLSLHLTTREDFSFGIYIYVQGYEVCSTLCTSGKVESEGKERG